MGRYRYRARLAGGKTASGVMDAKDETELQLRLKETGAFLLSSKSEDSGKNRRQIGDKYLSEFARQIGSLLGSGVTLVRAFGILLQEEHIRPKQRALYEEVRKKIRQGSPLSDALSGCGDAFPPLMIHMFRAAESSGSLDRTALELADLYEKAYKQKAKIRSAMTYPKILLVMILLVIFVITRFVLPQFAALLGSMDTLPPATALLLDIGDFMERYWYVAVSGLLILVAGVRLLLRVRRVRLLWHKVKVRLPVVGTLLSIIYTARFARTLSSLYAAGIPLVTALEIGKHTVGNDYIESQFGEVIHFIRSGHALSDGIGMVDGFVQKLSGAVRVGEETGKLDDMLKNTADILNHDADIAITKLVSYAEPVMILTMGVIVAFVMAAVFAALFGSYDAIGEL